MEARLREAPSEVQDAFARARAALDGYAVTGEWTPEAKEAVAEMLAARAEMGWDVEIDPEYDPNRTGTGPFPPGAFGA